MKTKSIHHPTSSAVESSKARISNDTELNTFARPEPSTPAEPDEANIRDRAYILYEEANRCDGHDIDHWVEATAQLKDKARGSWATTPHLIGS